MGLGSYGLLVTAKISSSRLLTLGLLTNAAGIALTGISGSLGFTVMAQLMIALFQPAIFIGNNHPVIQQTEAEYIGRVTGIRTPLMTGAMLAAMSMASLLKQILTLQGVYLLAGACFAAGLMFIRMGEKGAKQKGEAA